MHQQHLSNGSVVLVFEAFLSAPRAGETGTLTVSATDGSGPWSASQNISITSAGENNATVQVKCWPVETPLEHPSGNIFGFLLSCPSLWGPSHALSCHLTTPC